MTKTIRTLLIAGIVILVIWHWQEILSLLVLLAIAVIGFMLLSESEKRAQGYRKRIEKESYGAIFRRPYLYRVQPFKDQDPEQESESLQTLK